MSYGKHHKLKGKHGEHEGKHGGKHDHEHEGKHGKGKHGNFGKHGTKGKHEKDDGREHSILRGNGSEENEGKEGSGKGKEGEKNGVKNGETGDKKNKIFKNVNGNPEMYKQIFGEGALTAQQDNMARKLKKEREIEAEKKKFLSGLHEHKNQKQEQKNQGKQQKQKEESRYEKGGHEKNDKSVKKDDESKTSVATRKMQKTQQGTKNANDATGKTDDGKNEHEKDDSKQMKKKHDKKSKFFQILEINPTNISSYLPLLPNSNIPLLPTYRQTCLSYQLTDSHMPDSMHSSFLDTSFLGARKQRPNPDAADDDWYFPVKWFGIGSVLGGLVASSVRNYGETRRKMKLEELMEKQKAKR